MNHSIHFARICFKTSFVGICFLASASSFAHDTHHNSKENLNNTTSEQAMVWSSVSKIKARKITRKFLSARGFTKNIAPGGAHIRNIKSMGGFWVVEVALRDASAADVKKEHVFVHKMNGRLQEEMPESLRVALNNK